MNPSKERPRRGAAVAAAFGILVRQLRQPQCTQEKLAELAGIDPTYVQLLERGLRQPTVAVFLGLAAALRIEPAQLIDLTIAEIRRLDVHLGA